MSIVRVGMSEDSKFADGYDAIFGKKQAGAKTAKKPAASKKSSEKARTKKSARRK